MSLPANPVALVLAGGGARGAYEAGALSELLPVLEERGERPRIVVGTSVGALNASYIASVAHLPVEEAIPPSLAIWESIRWGEVVRRLISAPSLLRLGEYAGEVLGVPGARVTSVLDPAPLTATLRADVDFPQIERNVRDGHLDAAAVVATSSRTGRSVVFHSGLGSPPRDVRRGIDYVATALAEEHVLASSAIPSVFPAVHVGRPREARGWYIDGGTRLNTPVKPALEFGAARVVVVALTSLAAGPGQLADERRPDILEGAGQVLLGLLEDQLTSDLQTLATINEIADGPAARRAGKRRVPYIVIAPPAGDSIGRRALRVVRERYSGPLGLLRSPDLSLLARLTAAGADAQHAELLSFLLFAPEFGRALIELGRQDARRWIDQPHDYEGLWQLGPLDAQAGD